MPEKLNLHLCRKGLGFRVSTSGSGVLGLSCPETLRGAQTAAGASSALPWLPLRINKRPCPPHRQGLEREGGCWTGLKVSQFFGFVFWLLDFECLRCMDCTPGWFRNFRSEAPKLESSEASCRASVKLRSSSRQELRQ